MKPAQTSLLFALLLGLLPAAYAEDYDDEAYQNLITQCTRNQLDSCVTLGIWTRDYLESPADAYLPLKKACDGKNMKGCNVLANLYLDPYSGLGMDYPKALELYRKACKGGYLLFLPCHPEGDGDGKQDRNQCKYNACNLI